MHHCVCFHVSWYVVCSSLALYSACMLVTPQTVVSYLSHTVAAQLPVEVLQWTPWNLLLCLLGIMTRPEAWALGRRSAVTEILGTHLPLMVGTPVEPL